MKRMNIRIVMAGLVVVSALGGFGGEGAGVPKVSVFHWTVNQLSNVRKLTLEQSVALLRSVGVEGLDCDYREKRLAEYYAAGLKPASLFGFMHFFTEDGGRKECDEFVATAVKYGVPRIMCIPSSFTGGVFNDAEYAKNREALAYLVEAGRKAGVTVTVEDFGSSENMCSSVPHLKRLMKEIPDLKFALDSGNLVYSGTGGDILELMSFVKGRIAHVHLKDQPRSNTRDFVTLGLGVVPNERIVRTVRADGYDGWYTLENPVGEDPVDDIVRQIAVLRHWCATERDCRMKIPPAGRIVEDRPGYNSWPMIQSVGNKLVCIYSRGTKHDIFEGVRGVWAKTSADGGRTWSDPVKVVDEPDYGEVPIGKGLDESGAALFWVRCFGGRKPHHSLYRTTDGKTFECLSTPELSPLPMQITDVQSVPGRGLVALWFAGNYRDDDCHKCWGEVVSTDNGRTWTQRTIGAELAKDRWPTEPSFVRLPDGRLLGIARSERYDAEKALQWQLQSTDGGLTWTCEETNIRDVMASTPSLILDAKRNRLYNYYYERGKGVLKRRVVDPEAVWGKPRTWPAPETVAGGGNSPWDAGNANATVIGDVHYVSYYSGAGANTSVVVAPVRAE